MIGIFSHRKNIHCEDQVSNRKQAEVLKLQDNMTNMGLKKPESQAGVYVQYWKCD